MNENEGRVMNIGRRCARGLDRLLTADTLTRPLMIIGHGGHGKGTVAKLIPGVSFMSSSEWGYEHAIWPVLEPLLNQWGGDFLPPGKRSVFEDRSLYRPLFKELLTAFTAENPTRIADGIYANYGGYDGCRRRVEFEAIKEKYNPYVLWVDAFMRLGTREETCELNALDADYVIFNNGAQQDLANVAEEWWGLTETQDALS